VRGWASRVPPQADRLADAFWPGPLTIVLPRAAHVLDLVTGGQETVALRVPRHPVARDLLEAFGDGIVAPSANRFGRLSPTRADHVRAELGDTVDLILDGGPTEVGVESTIVDLSGDHPVLLRPGGITATHLASVLGAAPDAPNAASPRASGTLPSHYAPTTPLELVPTGDLHRYISLASSNRELIGVLARHAAPTGWQDDAWLHAEGDAEGYARTLYANLRTLDTRGYDRILVEDVPEGDEWSAVRDRLRRAAYRGEE
jgi:L-threonylcarbamoyladenylate synthase